jgi:hypothetical protein
MPDLRLKGVGLERAFRLGRAVMSLTQSDPALVRTIAPGFCSTAGSRFRIVFTRREQAYLGRQLYRAVRKTNVPWLALRVLGFRVEGQVGDVVSWLHLFGLTEGDAPIDYVKAHNQENHVSLDHVGLEVVNTLTGYVSREFFEVMLIASLIQLWNTVRADDGSDLSSGVA